jgi:hypothetical protein
LIDGEGEVVARGTGTFAPSSLLLSSFKDYQAAASS